MSELNAFVDVTKYEAWQAATLLVGLYGLNAPNYAAARRTKVQQSGDLQETQTWDMIVSEIDRVVHTAPAQS